MLEQSMSSGDLSYDLSDAKDGSEHSKSQEFTDSSSNKMDGTTDDDMDKSLYMSDGSNWTDSSRRDVMEHRTTENKYGPSDDPEIYAEESMEHTEDEYEMNRHLGYNSNSIICHSVIGVWARLEDSLPVEVLQPSLQPVVYIDPEPVELHQKLMMDEVSNRFFFCQF